MITLRPAVLVAMLVIASGPGRVRASGAAPVSSAALDTVLARHVRGGRVDYDALARDRGPLDRYLAAAARAEPDAWPRDEQVAFWVNTYNARVLAGVLAHPGLKSVLDVGKHLGVPTLGFFHEKRTTAGRPLSLDDIEHGILRARFHEPRLHFVLNCASASCPELPARALRAATLDSSLDAAARAFLRDPVRNRLDGERGLELSSIFKWYRGDFEAAAGSLPAFVARYATVRPNRVVRFIGYDWSLNGQWTGR